MSEETANLKLGSGLALKGLITLTVMLIASLFLCTISVIAYVYFFWGRPFLNTTELSVLLDSPSTIAFQILMNNLAYFFALIWCIRTAKTGFKETLNLNKSSSFSLLEATLLISSASILIDQFLYLVADIVFPSLSGSNLVGNLNIASILGNIKDNNFVTFNLLLFLTVIFSPVLEELFFRGFLWQALRKTNSFPKTLFITSGCFALIHFDLIQGINAFLVSMVYGFITEKTKSVWPCVVAHVTVSYITYVLSQKGLSYGVGGITYPQGFLLACSLIFVISFVLIFSKENPFSASKKNA